MWGSTVAETHGEVHAIQCKLAAPNHRIKADIDSFFTASGKLLLTASSSRRIFGAITPRLRLPTSTRRLPRSISRRLK